MEVWLLSWLFASLLVLRCDGGAFPSGGTLLAPRGLFVGGLAPSSRVWGLPALLLSFAEPVCASHLYPSSPPAIFPRTLFSARPLANSRAEGCRTGVLLLGALAFLSASGGCGQPTSDAARGPT